MTSSEQPGHHHDHAAVRPGPQYRRARRRTCRRRSPRRRANCRQHADAADPPQGQSGRLADPVHGDAARDACRSRRSTNMPKPAGAPDLHAVDGVAQVQVYGVAEICRAHPGRSRRAGRARHRHRPGRERGRSRPMSTIATGALNGPNQATADPYQRPADQRRRIQPTRSSPIATARRCASAMSASVIDSVAEHPGGELVQRPARHRARDPAPARLQHHRGRRRDQAQVLPHFQADPAGLGASRHPL